MAFFQSAVGTLQTLVAYDLLDVSEIRIKEDEYDMSCTEDGAGVLDMAKSIRAHWDRSICRAYQG